MKNNIYNFSVRDWNSRQPREDIRGQINNYSCYSNPGSFARFQLIMLQPEHPGAFVAQQPFSSHFLSLPEVQNTMSLGMEVGR